MSEVVKLRTRVEIEEEAATWIWRMEPGSDSGADPTAFEAWLRQDPRHRRAVEELTKVWGALDGLAQAHRPLEVPATHEPTAAPASAQPHRYAWLAAAALVLGAVGGAVLLQRGAEAQLLSTAVGEHRNVTLSDGTVVTLNTNTIVATHFSRHSRDIELRKGEAHFEVAADRGRPFLVHAGDAVVRAIGTGFEVRVRADHHVDVLVNEGRVEVEAEPSTPPTHTTGVAMNPAVAVVTVRAVSAGQQLSTSTANYPVTPISAEQVSSQLAWRDGAVVFDSEPLAQAIAEIQRYTDARIVISDPKIAALPVGGRFRTDDLQGFLDGLEAALPVTIRRTPDGTVYVAPHN